MAIRLAPSGSCASSGRESQAKMSFANTRQGTATTTQSSGDPQARLSRWREVLAAGDRIRAYVYDVRREYVTADSGDSGQVRMKIQPPPRKAPWPCSAS